MYLLGLLYVSRIRLIYPGLEVSCPGLEPATRGLEVRKDVLETGIAGLPKVRI